jgi:hypothetical protein
MPGPPRLIPRWQMIGILLLALAMLGMGVLGSPNSYAYKFLSGQCSKDPAQPACRARSWR